MKIFGQLEYAQFEVLASDPVSGLVNGRIIYNSTSKLPKYYDTVAAAWKSFSAGTNDEGMLSVDTSAASKTVSAGTTLYHPFLTIDTPHTYTINGQLVSAGTLTVDGTLIINSGATSIVLT